MASVQPAATVRYRLDGESVDDGQGFFSDHITANVPRLREACSKLFVFLQPVVHRLE